MNEIPNSPARNAINPIFIPAKCISPIIDRNINMITSQYRSNITRLIIFIFSSYGRNKLLETSPIFAGVIIPNANPHKYDLHAIQKDVSGQNDLSNICHLKAFKLIIRGIENVAIPIFKYLALLKVPINFCISRN